MYDYRRPYVIIELTIRNYDYLSCASLTVTVEESVCRHMTKKKVFEVFSDPREKGIK